MFPCHRSHSWISGGDHFLVENPYVLAFGIIENGRSWLFSTKMAVLWPLIIDQRIVHLTPHKFPCHRLHSWISGGDHFLVKNPNVLAFGIIENGRSWLFSTKMGVVWPFIIDERLVHLTPHMFPCHRSHSWISGGDHCLVKNPNVLAFSISEADYHETVAPSKRYFMRGTVHLFIGKMNRLYIELQSFPLGC
jgi:hypothetical protein